MVSFPPCKINLGLQILSKQPDGYHSIVTCFYPLPWEDVLEILPSGSLMFTQSGNPVAGKPEHNLCLRAYHLLKKDHKLPPVQIHLHKIIPTGAGLGGGSSDAAHTLRLLNALFTLELSQTDLMSYASQLGSDCAFFLEEAPMLGSGRGEILERVTVNVKGFYLRLFKPDIHISTAEAYANVIPKVPNVKLREVIEKPVRSWKEELKNDFENSVFMKHPILLSIKNELYESGAVYASMSGSGSSVFGIFEDDKPGNYPIKESWSGWL